MLATALAAVVEEMSVVAKSESSVRMSAVEYKFINVAKQCRDICGLAVRGDKRYLQEVFSPSDCARIGRMRHACQLVQTSYLHVTADLREELLASIASVEQVLRDSGSFKSWQPQCNSPLLDQAFIAEEDELDDSTVDLVALDRTAPAPSPPAPLPEVDLGKDDNEEEVAVGRIDSLGSTVELVDCECCESARSGGSSVGIVDCSDITASQSSAPSEAPSEESTSTPRELISSVKEDEHVGDDASLQAGMSEAITGSAHDPGHQSQQRSDLILSPEACKEGEGGGLAVSGEETFRSRTSEVKRPVAGPQRRSQKIIEIAPFTPRIWQRVGSPQWSSSAKETPVKRAIRRGGA